jgi:hypothetical protein
MPSDAVRPERLSVSLDLAGIWFPFVPAAYLPDLDSEHLKPGEQCVQRCPVPERPVHYGLDRLDRGGELVEIKQNLEREDTGYPDLIAGRWHRNP